MAVNSASLAQIEGAAIDGLRQGRQQHQHQHHGDVFHDQPADGDVAALGLDQAALLHGAQQHHGGGHRQRQAEHQARAHVPAQPPAQRHAQQGGDSDLAHRAGHGDGLHRDQVAQREMQADAEHQKNDADIGQLLHQPDIGDEAGGERPDGDARQQIAEQGRQLETVRERAKDEGEAKAPDKNGYERRGVMHGTNYTGR
jgi:hypothetical protein